MAVASLIYVGTLHKVALPNVVHVSGTEATPPRRGVLRKLNPFCGKAQPLFFIKETYGFCRLFAAFLGFLPKPVGVIVGHDD